MLPLGIMWMFELFGLTELQLIKQRANVAKKA